MADDKSPPKRLSALRPKSRNAKIQDISERFKKLVDGTDKKTNMAGAWPERSRYDVDDDNE